MRYCVRKVGKLSPRETLWVVVDALKGIVVSVPMGKRGALDEATALNDKVTTHYLKTLSEPFAEVWEGVKRYDIRYDDREFSVGDHLMLLEWTVATYTGRWIKTGILHLTRGAWGLPDTLSVLGFDDSLQRGSALENA